MSDQTVRTRFAPSPTGYLHVGGLRTALYSYLYAKQHSGQFVLRIEDTDQTRLVEGAMEQLMNSLKWTGIQYDEGPDRDGGNGPYIQSQRTEIYRRYAAQMVENGSAYHCFCTTEELEAMRERQIAAGEAPRYDGTWRDRSPAEVKSRLDAGDPHVIRLKMPREGETVFEDLVRGTIRIQNEQVDDQVLLKSDGFPTYHLAVVVDDHLMGITHIIRGEEWLLSVPKHLQIYKALGWESPNMAHLSLLLNPDRTKLSKRQGDVAVEDYMAKGYLPEALVNFVALLGWSPGSDEEFFSLEALVEQFSLERISRSGSVFDLEKLNWMNRHYLRQRSEDAAVKYLTPFLTAAGADVSDADKTRKIILAVRERINRGDEAYAAAEIFFSDTLQIREAEALAFLKEPSAKTVLAAFLSKAEALPALDMDSFKAAMKEVQQETGIKGQELWKPVRVALTGMISGPELPAVIGIFGKEKVCSFVKQVLNKYV